LFSASFDFIIYSRAKDRSPPIALASYVMGDFGDLSDFGVASFS